ncbi:MAG: carbohydrate-binding domain-containing protein, partial [Acutalibacteraceae bacterium]
MKKLMSVIICFAMLVSLIPIVSSAASETDVTYSAISSDEAVIEVPECSYLHAFVKDSSSASVTVDGDKATVKLLGDTPCIAFVTLHFDSVTKTLEIPLGYTVFSFSGDSLTVLDGADTNYKITAISQAGEEITPEASADDNGNAVYSNTDTHKLLVSIKKTGGTYAFTGTANDMSIAVNKEAASPTVLLFAGLDMSSSFTSPVTIKKDSTSTVTLNALVGHQNKLCDSALNNADLYGATADGGDGTNETFAESAVIKAKASADLTITGGGSLTLECNSKNAVKVGEYGALKIDSLNLNVTSADNGLSSDNTLEISSGNITVDSADDAIRSDPDAVDADAGCAGTITISGGTFNLTAGSDA